MLTICGFVIAGILVFDGCVNKRDDDVAAIKATYGQFRSALMNKDYAMATNYISSELLALYANPPEMVSNYFCGVTDVDRQLGSDSWVKFDRKTKPKAWLFPRRLPDVGLEFVKQTNGWKLTVGVLPIVH
jgi:hypothetical protein